MRAKNLSFFVVTVFLSVFVLWGCPKKADVSAVPEAPPVEAPKAEPVQEAPKAEPAPAPEPVKEEKPVVKEEPKERAAAAKGAVKPIYFDFDRSIIRNDAKAVLKANADWLKANPKAKIRIEGNCDERGTIEYNQALGQRRAQSAKKYLTDLGIAASRISLISYGKEKPICTDATEDCWQQNRRDEFVVVSE